MGPVDIRRLAAVDLYGVAGTRFRRSIITAEFIIGMVAGIAVGIAVLVSSDGLLWRLFGAYVATACSNYIPLTLHALSMARLRTLQPELAGADIGRELRTYSKRQFWLAVPFLFLVIGVPQAMGNRPIDQEQPNDPA